MADIKNEILWRIYTVMFFIIVFALFIFGKAVYIQTVQGNMWIEISDKEHVEFREVKAERGNIMAEDGSILASSLPYYEIRMDPCVSPLTDEIFYENIDSLAKCLSESIKPTESAAYYRNRIELARKTKERYLDIAKNISYVELERIKKFPIFNRGPFRGGFIAIPMNKRQRPFRMLAHRTIGYVREGAQPVGLEGAFDGILRGEAGKQKMQKVSGGYWIPVEDLTKIEPKRGHDIVTTIDVNMQDVAGNALLKALKKHDANHGSVVVMEVKTGAIRAIANIGKNRNGEYWETYNFAIGESMEPGSTFKTAAMMAMLEDKVVKLTDSINIDEGKAAFYDVEMVDASIHGLDSTSIQRAFEISSNVGIAQLVHQNYNVNGKGEKFIKRLKQFRLNQKTEIEIEGEGNPFLKEAYGNTWSGTTLPWMAIGYEVQLTPLQILTFYNAVANNGRMMKPYLVSKLQDYGKTYEEYTPVVLKKRIANEQTIKQMQTLLRGVVDRGTAKSIRADNYAIAGKTGTAQVNYLRFRPDTKMQYQASFAGYFPADKPEYSCIVVVNDPKQNGFYGSQVAAPVFREIADKVYAHNYELHTALNERPKPQLVSDNLPDFNIGEIGEIKEVLNYLGMKYEDESINTTWTVVRAEEETLALMPRKDAGKGLVPNVVGMGLRDAIYVLEKVGLKVHARGVGKVNAQSIKPYANFKRGQTITLSLK